MNSQNKFRSGLCRKQLFWTKIGNFLEGMDIMLHPTHSPFYSHYKHGNLQSIIFQHFGALWEQFYSSNVSWRSFTFAKLQSHLTFKAPYFFRFHVVWAFERMWHHKDDTLERFTRMLWNFNNCKMKMLHLQKMLQAAMQITCKKCNQLFCNLLHTYI